MLLFSFPALPGLTALLSEVQHGVFYHSDSLLPASSETASRQQLAQPALPTLISALGRSS